MLLSMVKISSILIVIINTDCCHIILIDVINTDYSHQYWLLSLILTPVINTDGCHQQWLLLSILTAVINTDCCHQYWLLSSILTPVINTVWKPLLNFFLFKLSNVNYITQRNSDLLTSTFITRQYRGWNGL